jgi:hypothetical protein
VVAGSVVLKSVLFVWRGRSMKDSSGKVRLVMVKRVVLPSFWLYLYNNVG